MVGLNNEIVVDKKFNMTSYLEAKARYGSNVISAEDFVSIIKVQNGRVIFEDCNGKKHNVLLRQCLNSSIAYFKYRYKMYFIQINSNYITYEGIYIAYLSRNYILIKCHDIRETYYMNDIEGKNFLTYSNKG